MSNRLIFVGSKHQRFSKNIVELDLVCTECGSTNTALEFNYIEGHYPCGYFVLELYCHDCSMNTQYQKENHGPWIYRSGIRQDNKREVNSND